MLEAIAFMIFVTAIFRVIIWSVKSDDLVKDKKKQKFSGRQGLFRPGKQPMPQKPPQGGRGR